ncbi:MAG TPA: AI-2E family transporter [Chloroflexota bacterium]|nr:AI-2E family transporter [Chloroflexota bacterium]
MNNSRWLRLLIILLVASVALHLGGILWSLALQFGDIIIVFFLAWLLAFVLSPATDFLRDEFGIARALAAGICYLGLFIVVAGFSVLMLPLIIQQVIQVGEALPALANQIPGWQANLQAGLDSRQIDIDLGAAFRGQDLSARIGELGTGLAQNAVGVLTGAAGVVVAFILMFVLSFYIVLDGEAIRNQVIQLIPDSVQEDVRYFLDSMNRSFGGFLRGMLIMAFINGLGTAAIMLAAGLSYVPLASIFAGIIVLIPFIGPVIGMLPPIALAFANGSLTLAIAVTIALIVLQQIIFNVITPKVMSESMGMHPLLIFAAILVGTRVAGLAGAVFGVPIVAVLWAMMVLWINRSRFGQLALARQEANDVADGESVVPVKRFRVLGQVWVQITSRMPGRGPSLPTSPGSRS